jgi:hypothetical protein
MKKNIPPPGTMKQLITVVQRLHVGDSGSRAAGLDMPDPDFRSMGITSMPLDQ